MCSSAEKKEAGEGGRAKLWNTGELMDSRTVDLLCDQMD